MSYSAWSVKGVSGWSLRIIIYHAYYHAYAYIYSSNTILLSRIAYSLIWLHLARQLYTYRGITQHSGTYLAPSVGVIRSFRNAIQRAIVQSDSAETERYTQTTDVLKAFLDIRSSAKFKWIIDSRVFVMEFVCMYVCVCECVPVCVRLGVHMHRKTENLSACKCV